MTIQLQKSEFATASAVFTKPAQATLIVVPCYNEADRLNDAAFIEYVDQTEGVSFLFVNDGSTDATLERLSQICSLRPDRLHAISLTENSGKAEAVRQGLLHASTMGAGLVGYWDADLATPLDAIEDFVRVASKYRDISVIFGSRRTMLGHRIERTFFRKTVSKVCSTLAYQALRLPISDTQCGAKLFRNSNELRASLKDPFSAGWLFDVELFTRLASRLNNKQNAFYEQPLSEWEEVAGSKVSAKAIVRAGFSMLRLIAENRLGLPSARRTDFKVPTALVISPTMPTFNKLAA